MSAARHAAEAARWYMVLQQADATPQTFIEWERWMGADASHRAAYQGVERMMRVALAVQPRLAAAQELDADRYDGSQPVAEWKAAPRRARKSWVPYAIAAGIAALCVLGGRVGLDAYRRAQLGTFAFQTAPGERREFDLPDGSRVTLDAGSALSVQLSAERRSLELERGEAYFEVAKDAARPFFVRAGGTLVRAVGTAFDVRLSADRTVVAVTEGRVEVRSEASPAETAGSAHAAKSPGDKHPVRISQTAEVSAGAAVAYAGRGGLQELPAADAALAAAWRSGRRQYRNEPLRYVLADIDRYTGRRIAIADEATGELKFTGTLDLANSSTWLRGLGVALPVRITESVDGQLAVQAR